MLADCVRRFLFMILFVLFPEVVCFYDCCELF